MPFSIGPDIPNPKNGIARQGAKQVREIFAARGRIFVFEGIRYGPVIDGDQHQIALSGIIEPQRICQLRAGREMQEAIGLIVGRAMVKIANSFPFGTGDNFENQGHVRTRLSVLGRKGKAFTASYLFGVKWRE